MATQAESEIDYAVLTSGGFHPSLRDAIVERAGVAVDDLAKNRTLLTETIGRHRQEHPEHFISERESRGIAKMPEARRGMAMLKASMAMRDKTKSLANEQERSVARMGRRAGRTEIGR